MWCVSALCALCWNVKHFSAYAVAFLLHYRPPFSVSASVGFVRKIAVVVISVFQCAVVASEEFFDHEVDKVGRVAFGTDFF